MIMVDVSVVILNYRSRRLVRQCLKAYFAAPPQHVHEVIVVDNASGDGVGEMLRREFPDVRFVAAPRNGGVAYGNNLGLAAARGRHLLVMNPDILVGPGAVDALVAFLDAHPDVGMVGPKLVLPDGTVDESCYRFPTLLVPLYRRTPLGRLPAARTQVQRYLMADLDRDEVQDVDWLLGAAFLMRREALQQAGPQDERYFMYFEDTDWCRSFWQAGWRVTYFPGSSFIHFHDRSSARHPWYLAPFVSVTARAHLVSWVKYFAKHRLVVAPPARRGLTAKKK